MSLLRRMGRRVLPRRSAPPQPDEDLSGAARAYLEQPGYRATKVDGRRVVVGRLRRDPWRNSAELARRVQLLLAGLGVDHWAVHPRWARASRWAVRAEDLAQVLDRLAAELAQDCWYLRVRGTGGEARPLADGLPEGLGEPLWVELFRYTEDGSGRIHDDDAVCYLEGWGRTPRGTLAAPGRGGVVHELEDTSPVATAPVAAWDGTRQPRPAAAARADAAEVDFPVDAVYLWVDGSDPEWRARRDARHHELGAVDDPETLAPHRFRDRGELRASLRSLDVYAPWVRNVFLVTDGQRPAWLDPASSRVRVVDHREIFADPTVLPTFNSHAIGSQLHRIAGLAEHYLVLNDDILFNRPVTPYDFFTAQGALRIVLSRSRRPVIETGALTPLERARQNSAELIERDHGQRVLRLFAHVPIPQSKSIAEEVALRYPDEIARTAAHPFRTAEDYETNSWLNLYTALLTGRAAVVQQPFAYFDLGDPAARQRMDRGRSYREALTLCVNDSPGSDPEEVERWYAEWLLRSYPEPAAHELG